MTTVVILAAGKGTRMNDSVIPKTCRKVQGKPMIQRVVETSESLQPSCICVVVSKDNIEIIRKILPKHINLVEQKEINGTASAVLAAEQFYQQKNLLVLLGDVPLIKSETLSKCTKSQACILGFCDDNPDNKFGRIVLNGSQVEKIVEYNEASSTERQIRQVNSGMLYLDKSLTYLLKQINNNNSKKEYYLTDIVEILRKENVKVDYVEADKKECLGANTPDELKLLNNF